MTTSRWRNELFVYVYSIHGLLTLAERSGKIVWHQQINGIRNTKDPSTLWAYASMSGLLLTLLVQSAILFTKHALQQVWKAWAKVRVNHIQSNFQIGGVDRTCSNVESVIKLKVSRRNADIEHLCSLFT